jgi:hypothetical protein
VLALYLSNLRSDGSVILCLSRVLEESPGVCARQKMTFLLCLVVGAG